MCFSTSVLGALGDLVVVKVVLTGARVASDGNGQCSGTCKREDKVHEVEDCQEDWGGQEGDKEGNDTVEGGGENTPCCCENTVADLRVVVVDGGGSQGGSQTQRNGQEDEVDNSKSDITVGQHCILWILVECVLVCGIACWFC